MRIRYDRDADALYIQLVPGQIEPGGAVDAVIVAHDGTELSINIDLDPNGRPIGIEILDVASRGLEGDRVIVDPVAEATGRRKAAAA